ncbi:MAG: hypothetical protein JNJ59_18990 [Deltaproteobacteria bacterium]|nr:hypothetical protein [Deltaproteobacteria bacterium]
MLSLKKIFALASTLFALGCGGGSPMWGAPPPGGGWGGNVPGAPQAEAEAKCDPKGCSDFCMNMRCMDGSVGPDECIAKCQSRCGDGYFEEQDAGVMKCVAAVGPSLDCGSARTCCREYLTNQLCE